MIQSDYSMCKTQNNTVCNKTNTENNLPDQSIQTIITQSVFKNLFRTGLPVFSVHLCKDYRLAGGIRADAPVVVSLKTDQSACVY